ncbi:MAG: MFS transporter [Acidimicrobiales bacterium]|jgi:MFS family permease|nr:MFS transporter [Acidimicrobiales bacterium]MDP6298553.1 MFS transporter [Acidimicrobiales bacterium]HJM29138.1 MFS transporter [Acidimicrobiales bacterium]HJM97454.1 MFS transporter [Acidimicrobiales bacterium]
MTEVNSGELLLLQRRTIRTLMTGLVPAGAALTSAYSAAAVLGEELTDSETLGGLAAASATVGSAIATLLLARMMVIYGRRPGLLTGYAVASVGSLIAMTAALTGWYLLLIPGILSIGVGGAASLAARFAAADLATPDHRARAIGTLVWASTIGAVLGPTIGFGPAKRFAQLIGIAELAGPYLISSVLFAIAAAVIHFRLRPDPLIVAGGLGASKKDRGFKGAVKSIAGSAIGKLAVGSMATGHIVMVGVMTMTPLHMNDGGHELEIIGFVISLHIIGMYAAAPIIGWVVDRLTAGPVLALGGMLLFIGSEMASHTEPSESAGVFIGLFLIGLGWSCGLIASSVLLTNEFEGSVRVRVQGLADTIMSASGGAAGLGSGLMVSTTDYRTLCHYVSFIGLVPVMGFLFLLFRTYKKNLTN